MIKGIGIVKGVVSGPILRGAVGLVIQEPSEEEQEAVARSKHDRSNTINILPIHVAAHLDEPLYNPAVLLLECSRGELRAGPHASLRERAGFADGVRRGWPLVASEDCRR